MSVPMDDRCRLARTDDTICHTDGVRLPDCWMLPASSSRPSSTNWSSRSICPSSRFPSHKKERLCPPPTMGARTEPLFLFPPLRGSPKWAAYMACNNDSIWNYRHLCIFIVVRVVFLAEICYICMKV